MPSNNDAALVKKTLAGDRSAFDVLVKRYRPPVCALALRIVKEPDDAQDVVQTAFAKAFQKLYTFKPNFKFFSWIYRIGLNEALNFVKRRSGMEEYESGVSAVNELTPESSFKQGELAEKVGDAIRQLRTDYRMVLVLRHYHDFSYQEMSEILQVPEKTVKSRLFTARRRLREILEDGDRG